MAKLRLTKVLADKNVMLACLILKVSDRQFWLLDSDGFTTRRYANAKGERTKLIYLKSSFEVIQKWL